MLHKNCGAFYYVSDIQRSNKNGSKVPIQEYRCTGTWWSSLSGSTRIVEQTADILLCFRYSTKQQNGCTRETTSLIDEVLYCFNTPEDPTCRSLPCTHSVCRPSLEQRGTTEHKDLGENNYSLESECSHSRPILSNCN